MPNWNDIKGVKVIGGGKMSDGVRKLFTGKNVMAVLNEIEPLTLAEIYTHSHPHEQLVYIIEGTGKFALGKETFDVGPGDIFLAPPNVPHGLIVTGKKKMINLDIFSPIREDFIKLAEEAK